MPHIFWNNHPLSGINWKWLEFVLPNLILTLHAYCSPGNFHFDHFRLRKHLCICMPLPCCQYIVFKVYRWCTRGDDETRGLVSNIPMTSVTFPKKKETHLRLFFWLIPFYYNVHISNKMGDTFQLGHQEMQLLLDGGAYLRPYAN